LRRVLSGRSGDVARTLRGRILDGTYAPGSKLPTFDSLVDEFGLSRASLQLAIKQLRDDGFVFSLHRSGIFVVDYPPHTHQFALAFARRPGSIRWNNYHAALHAESEVVAAARTGVSIQSYFAIDNHPPSPSLKTLLHDAEHHRIAGTILTPGTAFLLQSEGFAVRERPCVAVSHEPEDAPGIPVVNFDTDLLFQKAVRRLAERKCKRAAYIGDHLTMRHAPVKLTRYGMELHPHGICPIGKDYRGTVYAIVRLLLGYPKSQRPDGLIIATDTHEPEALSALHDAGIRIGRDIQVVAHCNWPWPVDSPMPVHRLGYHIHDMLNACIDRISAMRTGQDPPLLTRIEPFFEEELKERHLIASHAAMAGMS